MYNSSKYLKYDKSTAAIVGFLFITLGASTQAETSWLFTVGGLLSLSQALYLQFKGK